MKVDFALAGDNTRIGSKDMDAVPQVGDEVEVEGKMFKVEDQPRDPSSAWPTVWVTLVDD